MTSSVSKGTVINAVDVIVISSTVMMDTDAPTGRVSPATEFGYTVTVVVWIVGGGTQNQPSRQ